MARVERSFTAEIKNNDHHLLLSAVTSPGPGFNPGTMHDDPIDLEDYKGWEVYVLDVLKARMWRTDAMMFNVFVFDLDTGKKMAQVVVETLVGASVGLAWKED